jgi:broad specificity phosphatase PhoE
MKILIITTLLILGVTAYGMPRDSDEIFSIYLVRHAEKVTTPADPDNPGLSDCGESRAEGLARILADVKLEKIYSTDYQRTKATAWPVARRLTLEIELYDPGELAEFSRMLLNQQEDALVVGHSNTTPVLAGMLAGEALEPFDEAFYDRLYLVTVSGGQARMTLLHQGFRCDG